MEKRRSGETWTETLVDAGMLLGKNRKHKQTTSKIGNNCQGYIKIRVTVCLIFQCVVIFHSLPGGFASASWEKVGILYH